MSKPRRPRVIRNISFARETWEQLERLSIDRDESKSALIRRYVTEGIAREERKSQQ